MGKMYFDGPAHDITIFKMERLFSDLYHFSDYIEEIASIIVSEAIELMEYLGADIEIKSDGRGTRKIISDSQGNMLFTIDYNSAQKPTADGTIIPTAYIFPTGIEERQSFVDMMITYVKGTGLFDDKFTAIKTYGKFRIYPELFTYKNVNSFLDLTCDISPEGIKNLLDFDDEFRYKPREERFNIVHNILGLMRLLGCTITEESNVDEPFSISVKTYFQDFFTLVNESNPYEPRRFHNEMHSGEYLEKTVSDYILGNIYYKLREDSILFLKNPDNMTIDDMRKILECLLNLREYPILYRIMLVEKFMELMKHLDAEIGLNEIGSRCYYYVISVDNTELITIFYEDVDYDELEHPFMSDKEFYPHHYMLKDLDNDSFIDTVLNMLLCKYNLNSEEVEEENMGKLSLNGLGEEISEDKYNEESEKKETSTQKIKYHYCFKITFENNVKKISRDFAKVLDEKINVNNYNEIVCELIDTLANKLSLNPNSFDNVTIDNIVLLDTVETGGTLSLNNEIF